MTLRRLLTTAVCAAGIALAGGLAIAGQYGPGAGDHEIKIGNTMPYSGPGSGYGAIGKALAAYFTMINDHGGINGRRIDFISRDDGYSPPKTVEQVRKLVEEDQVLVDVPDARHAAQLAIRGYLNDNKVPQLFVGSGADQWNDPAHYPWTMGWQPSYGAEARIFARYILKNLPNAKIAVLYQNDDFGKDYLNGLRRGLGDKGGKMIVATQSYETTDPTVDSQIVALHGSGADVLLTAAIPKFTTLAIRKVYDIGWRPTQFLNSVSTFGRHRHEARRARERRRHHLRGLQQGPDRSAMAGHAGIQGVAGLDEEIQSRRPTSPTPSTFTVTAPRRRWSRCSKRAATISPART